MSGYICLLIQLPLILLGEVDGVDLKYNKKNEEATHEAAGNFSPGAGNESLKGGSVQGIVCEKGEARKEGGSWGGGPMGGVGWVGIKGWGWDGLGMGISLALDGEGGRGG